MDNSTERLMLELILECSPLEWAKSSTRYVNSVIDGREVIEDRSSTPPFISFRLPPGGQDLARTIKNAVESYAGAIDWVVAQHEREPRPGINYSIYPKFVDDIARNATEEGVNPIAYCRTHMPEMGAAAHDDLRGLLSHMRSQLASM